jgi:hypothetical protein
VDVLTVDHDTRKLLQEQSAQGIVVAFGQQVEKGTIHDGRLEGIAIGAQKIQVEARLFGARALVDSL